MKILHCFKNKKTKITASILRKTHDCLEEPLNFGFHFLDGGKYLEKWDDVIKAINEKSIYPKICLYVHFPFCYSICSFCCLITEKYPNRELVNLYFQCLISELEIWSKKIKNIPISNIYIGGGSPDILSPDQLEILLHKIKTSFSREPDCRIGMELHPSNITLEKLAVLKKYDNNRVSYGIQSVIQNELKRSNRINQNVEKIHAAIKMSRNIGIPLINIDILTGLPGQTIRSFNQTMEFVKNLDVDTITVNRTLVENSTLLRYGYYPGKKENKNADNMLFSAHKILKEKYPHVKPNELREAAYGVPFSLKEDAREDSYFQEDLNGPASVIGVGYGAMSHIHNRLFARTNGTFHDYMNAFGKNHFPDMLVNEITPRFEAALFFSKQLFSHNFNSDDFLRIFNIDYERIFSNEIDVLISEGILIKKENQIYRKENNGFRFLHFFIFFLCSYSSLIKSKQRIIKLLKIQRKSRIPSILYKRNQKIIYLGNNTRLNKEKLKNLRKFKNMRFHFFYDPEKSKADFNDNPLLFTDNEFARKNLWLSMQKYDFFTIKKIIQLSWENIFINLKSTIIRDRNFDDGLEELNRLIINIRQLNFPLTKIVIYQIIKNNRSLLDSMINNLLKVQNYHEIRFLFELRRPLSLKQTETLMDFVSINKIKLNIVFRNRGIVTRQYKSIRDEFPPSLLYCRFAFKAFEDNYL